jgi:hypothetical protein
VIYRDLDGEAVILNLKTGVYFGLDTVGTRMWALISEHGRREKVLEVMLTEYEVDDQRLGSDLDNLVTQLLDHGLLEHADEPSVNGSAGH